VILIFTSVKTTAAGRRRRASHGLPGQPGPARPAAPAPFPPLLAAGARPSRRNSEPLSSRGAPSPAPAADPDAVHVMTAAGGHHSARRKYRFRRTDPPFGPAQPPAPAPGATARTCGDVTPVLGPREDNHITAPGRRTCVQLSTGPRRGVCQVEPFGLHGIPQATPYARLAKPIVLHTSVVHMWAAYLGRRLPPQFMSACLLPSRRTKFPSWQRRPKPHPRNLSGPPVNLSTPRGPLVSSTRILRSSPRRQRRPARPTYWEMSARTRPQTWAPRCRTRGQPPPCRGSNSNLNAHTGTRVAYSSASGGRPRSSTCARLLMPRHNLSRKPTLTLHRAHRHHVTAGRLTPIIPPCAPESGATPS
jgi:hypothetical protein